MFKLGITVRAVWTLMQTRFWGGVGQRVMQYCIFFHFVGQLAHYVSHIFVFIFVSCSMLFFFYVSGKRFNYTFYDKSCGKIWQSIETLDKAVCIHLISLWMQNKATVIALWTIWKTSHTYLSTSPLCLVDRGVVLKWYAPPNHQKTTHGEKAPLKTVRKCDTGTVE